MNTRSQAVDASLLLQQRGWMRRLATELLRDPHAAEDAVQDALCRALESPPRAKSPGVLRAWLSTVLRHRVHQLHRGKGLRQWHESSRARDLEEAAPMDQRLELESRLTLALQRLKAPWREVIVLRFLEGLEPVEIGDRLGLNEAAVRQRLSRGLAELRSRMEPAGHSRSRGVLLGLCALRRRGLGLMDPRVAVGGLVAAAMPLLLWLQLGSGSAVANGPVAPAPSSATAMVWRQSVAVERRRPVQEPAAAEPQAPGEREAEPDVPADLDAAVDRYLEPLVQAKLFSGTVLLAKGGEVLHSKAYGRANYEMGSQLQEQSRFKLMSVTKPLTAVALMTLVQAGQAELDAPVGQYLEAWPQPWAAVTLRQLLSHTSGIPNLELEWATIARQSGDRGLAVWTELSGQIAQRSLQFEAGRRVSYSNFNLMLVAAVIEAITGYSYPKALRESVLRPAQMVHTGHDTGGHAPFLAKGYFRGGDGGLDPSVQDMSTIRGAGDLYSSTLDLWRLDRALVEGRLLDAEHRAQMTQVVKSSHALGWIVSEVLGERCVHHSGGANGYVADFLRFPDQDAVVIVLSNFAFAPIQRLSRDLAGMLFGREVIQPVRLAEEDLDRLVGVYAAPEQPNRRVLVERSGELLLIFDVLDQEQRCGGRLMIAVGPRTFDSYQGGSSLVFEEGEDGQPMGLTYSYGSWQSALSRRPVEEARWRLALGDYVCRPKWGEKVSLVETGAGFELQIEKGWPTRVPLTLLSDDLAIGRLQGSFGMQFHLVRDPMGVITGFLWEDASGVKHTGSRLP